MFIEDVQWTIMIVNHIKSSQDINIHYNQLHVRPFHALNVYNKNYVWIAKVINCLRIAVR